MKSALSLSLLVLPWLAKSLPQHKDDGQLMVTREVGNAKGAVASEYKICSQMGIDILALDGTAADAMVTTTLCVGVMGMYHSGIGGGGFMLIRGPDGKLESVDYRETAPAAAYQDMFKDKEAASRSGGLAAGVPGELRGLEYMHKKHGCLPWATVVMPAAQLARDGFNLTDDHVRYFAKYMNGSLYNHVLVKDPVWAEDFAPNGTLLGLGDLLTRKRYATTLETIAEKGVDEFYTGELAKSIINSIANTGGIMTLEDLKNYTVLVKEPLSIDYRGYKLHTTQAASSGAVALSMLKSWEQYSLDESLSDKNLTLHRVIEGMKFAYGARMDLGDPAFVAAVTQLETDMLGDDWAKRVGGTIKDDTTLPIDAYLPSHSYGGESHGTSHIVATDRSGLTLTSTTTINLLFGAEVMTPDTGIILNNEMNDFSIPGKTNAFGFPPSPNNFVGPGKRPLSSISPVISEFANGTFFFATGAAGGSRIISSTAQTAWRLLDEGASMLDAISAHRFHDQLMPAVTELERSAFASWDNGTFDELKRRGHNVTWVADVQCSVQGVRRRWDGTFEAASEIRQAASGGLTL